MSLLGVAFGLLAAYLISSGDKGRIILGHSPVVVVNFYKSKSFYKPHLVFECKVL